MGVDLTGLFWSKEKQQVGRVYCFPLDFQLSLLFQPWASAFEEQVVLRTA